jgi:5'-nucleotidase
MAIWRKSTYRKILVLSVLFFVLFPLFVNGSFASNEMVKVHILGVNDFHGQLTRVSKYNDKPVGTAAYLAAHLKARKALDPEHTFLVHAGDMVGASGAVSALLQDEPTIEFMNATGFDIGIPGNHEFDEGPDEMMRLIYGGAHPKTGPTPFIGANFPYIAANVVYKGTNQPLFPPSIIKEVDGIKIGFIGVVTKDTPLTSTPGSTDNLLFSDEVDAINKEVENVKRKGANTIIVIAHEGGLIESSSSELSGRIVDIAKSLRPEVSVIIAGHTHLFNNQEVNGKLIVQSKCYGSLFEDVTLDIDSHTGKVVSKEVEFVPTYHEGITPDPEVERIVNHAKEKVAPFISQVVGCCEHGIKVDQNEAGESPLGEFIADAQRNMMKTDFVLVNVFGVRANISAGDVTIGELYEIQPHGNTLTKMSLTGEQIRRLLNQQFKNNYRPQILQPSGFTFSYDPNRPEHDRIVDITADDGTPLQDNKSYTMSVTNFLAAGGDGFSVLKEGIHREECDVDVDALIAYVKEMPNPFSFQVDGRIRKIGS